MDFKTIILKKQDNIATITLNRPDRLNSVNEELVTEMAAALRDVGKDDDIRVLILTGARPDPSLLTLHVSWKSRSSSIGPRVRLGMGVCGLGSITELSTQV